MHETLIIGGKKFEFERFGHYRFERDYGYRMKTGSWHMPETLKWKMEDGSEEAQFWLIDLNDRKDILSPNYVSKDTIK